MNAKSTSVGIRATLKNLIKFEKITDIGVYEREREREREKEKERERHKKIFEALLMS